MRIKKVKISVSFLMGFNRRRWHIVIVDAIFFFSLLMLTSMVPRGSSNGLYDSESLDRLFHNYANGTIFSRNHTGLRYKIILPSNYTGVHLTVIRVRSGRLFERGLNISSIQIPPKVMPVPYIKRIALVYENLGNLSSSYFKAPNHKVVANVIGFHVYDATDTTSLGDEKLGFNVVNDPILIEFPPIKSKHKQVTRKCAEFVHDKSPVITDMVGDKCAVRHGGHFSVVVPLRRVKKRRRMMGWVAGTLAAVVGTFVVGCCAVVIVKCLGRRKIRKMQQEAEKEVALEATWISDESKMPTASPVRTKPALEHRDVP